MKITYYGHSCFGIETMGKHLLFDPFVSGNQLALHIDVDQIPADYILVSHAHADHIGDLESIATRTHATIIGSWELVTHYSEKGYTGHPMNFGGQWKFDFGTIHLVQAVHTSSFSDGKYGGVAGGFVIESEGKTIYYSGDTALFSDMKLFGELYSIDWALLPIGDNFTMNANHAALASTFLQCDQVIGLHYNTFGFIKIDVNEAKQVFKDHNKILTLLDIGESKML